MLASISASKSSLLFSGSFALPPPPPRPPRPPLEPPLGADAPLRGPGLLLGMLSRPPPTLPTPPPLTRLRGSAADAISLSEPAISILIGLPSRGTPLYCFNALMASLLLSKTTSAVPRLLPLRRHRCCSHYFRTCRDPTAHLGC